ncbi:MAG: hypothetical protein ABI488_02880 [Polyangiaceae bacterium]
MAFKSVAVPLLSGAALLVGYVAFSWRRRRRAFSQHSERALGEEVEPLSSRLEHVSEEQAIDLELDRHPESDVDPPQLNEHASEYASDIRALFIARVTEALSPFPAHPNAEDRFGKPT